MRDGFRDEFCYPGGYFQRNEHITTCYTKRPFPLLIPIINIIVVVSVVVVAVVFVALFNVFFVVVVFSVNLTAVVF